ncbi:MAG: PadR family transcriptional regulator [Clostridiales bacterium]|nr:PadR family transcriptional regulator [Clostridiales bacterium]
MVDRAQLLKGLLDGCILKVISQGETYGYRITGELNACGFRELNEGSVYPSLMRLEKKGLVSAVTKKSSIGPSRKYYSLTAEGAAYLSEFAGIWSDISDTVGRIMKGGMEHEPSREE